MKKVSRSANKRVLTFILVYYLEYDIFQRNPEPYYCPLNAENKIHAEV